MIDILKPLSTIPDASGSTASLNENQISNEGGSAKPQAAETNAHNSKLQQVQVPPTRSSKRPTHQG